MQSQKNSRWYDNDPTVSLAISFLRNTDNKSQEEAARFILDKSIELGLDIHSKSKPFKLFNRRWYDSSDNLYKALETLKIAKESIQKAIAVELIDFLCASDATAYKDLV